MAKEKQAQHKTWTDAVLIPISQLILTEWNTNVMDDEEFAVLCKEIADGGFDEPCQVVPIKGEQGKYLVLGGEHRYKAMLTNGRKEVPCIIKMHLSDADEKELMLWSVKRNNIRGKIDEQKYAKLEAKLLDKWGVAAEAARREMLIRDEMLAKLQRSPALEDNESIELSDDDDDLSNDDPAPTEGRGDSKGSKPKGERPATDGERDVKKKFADRRALLQALKSAEQEVLLESADTVEQGYLFFCQGGGTHLVVDETKALHDLVAEMVSVVKNNSEKVNDFLVSAITKELPNWR
jgi:ParB-like chromosome segregation protein Spo0J